MTMNPRLYSTPDTFVLRPNLLLATDSYKPTHGDMLEPGTSMVYSHHLHRGGDYDETVFFGLQYILKRFMLGRVVQPWMVDEAEEVWAHHFPKNVDVKATLKRWRYLIRYHDGCLPLVISAVPEGHVSRVGTPLFDINNTDPETAWLTNYVESLMMHVWYPSTIATVGRDLLFNFGNFVPKDFGGLKFMLHDFGYRGASSHESAGIGGAAHLVHFLGTDTLEGMRVAHNYYGASYANLGYSVAATEHSIMTGRGVRYSDIDVLKALLPKFKGGILSVVADSYDYKNFIDEAISLNDEVQRLNIKLVPRPDSLTEDLHSPSDVVVWTFRRFHAAGLTQRATDGLLALPDHYAILWGDGLTVDAMIRVLQDVVSAGFSPTSLVFGMGGGRLQRVSRDTLKTATKCSAQQRNGEMIDVYKETFGKKSLRGVVHNPHFKNVFRDGDLLREYTFDEVRANANVPRLAPVADDVAAFAGSNN